MNTEKNHRLLLLAGVFLILAALACNAPGSATPTPVTPSPSHPITPSPSHPVTPSPTPAPDISGPGGCTLNARYVTDVTVPDNTEFAPGAAFNKVWRVRNSGTCTWETGTQLVFVSGEPLGGPAAVDVPAVAPGSNTDISANLVAPAAPGTYRATWQLQTAEGVRFGSQVYVQIVVVEPTTAASTPTEEPTEEPTPTPPPAGLAILYFRANVAEANPGDTITLEWASTGATKAIVYHLMPTGQFGNFWEVSTTGSMDYHIDPGERNQTRFTLSVISATDEHLEETITIVLRCPDEWFFPGGPDECPSGPAVVSPGAEQHFEHGVMVWVGAMDRIYVLYDDSLHSKWEIFTDEFEEGMPESDPTIVPPSGLYQPIRGFGKVWREKSGVRDRLGWATDQEAGFETAVQFTSRPKYNDTYIRALDGGVWKLEPEASGWSHIP